MRSVIRIEEPQEWNRLIAEFMGGKYKTVYNGVDNSQQDYFFMPNDTIDNPRRDFARDLPYHTSWDWLMPVVEKIEQLGFDSRINGNNSDGGFLCDFVDEENNEAACSTSYISKIEVVWDAIVQFIQWYNSKATSTVESINL